MASPKKVMISFSKIIPWSFVQDNFIGDWSVSLLFPDIVQIDSEFGILIFLSVTFWQRNYGKYIKRSNPLEKTKEVYKNRNQFQEIELKEFSVLFLAINNLDVFRKNIELISEVTFSNDLINEFKQKLVNYLLSEDFFKTNSLICILGVGKIL